MLAAGTKLDIGDHSVEVRAGPDTLGDRYLLRIEADPGGPGIKGDFPHLHPSLVETFLCVSGSMVARVDRQIGELPVGESVTADRGQVHGFVNNGDTQLIVDSEVIFPDGYDPSLDLMHFAHIYDRLRRERGRDEGTVEPPLLQMAVLTHEWRAVIRQPGLAGMMMPVLATVGRLMGYRRDPFSES